MSEKEIQWGEILSSLSSSSMYFRPKEGRTRVRLLLPKGEAPTKFYREVQTSYNGKVKPRYLVMALIFDGEGVSPEMAKTATPMVIAKTVLKGIISLLVEGYDLFDPEEGHGLTIIRTGQGLNTDYSVMPSQKPIPIPADITWPSDDFDTIAETFTQGSFEMDKQRQSGDGGAPRPTSGNLLDDF